MNQQHCQQLVHTILYTDHPSIHELVHTVMWDPSTDEIYPEDIYQENAHIVLASLQSQPMADPSPLTALIVIVNHAEARDAPDRKNLHSSFRTLFFNGKLTLVFFWDPGFHFRLTLTRFLIACAQPQAPHLSWALSCLSHHCPYLFTKTNNHDVENMQQELFTLCLRLRSLNGVKDIEVYHLLYNILRDLKLPCEARQAGVRQTKESRFYQSLALCDSLLDNCVDCPSDYRKWVSAFAKEIPPSLVSDSISIQLQFQLYNTLYKNELAAFLRELTNLGIVDLSNTIQLSSVFTEVIQSIPKSILSMLDCYVERRASAYKSPVEVEHLPYFEKLMEGITSSPPNIVQLTRECGLALSVSQARLITPITICLTHIMRAAMKYETEVEFCQMSVDHSFHYFNAFFDRKLLICCSIFAPLRGHALSHLCLNRHSTTRTRPSVALVKLPFALNCLVQSSMSTIPLISGTKSPRFGNIMKSCGGCDRLRKTSSNRLLLHYSE
ncbi:uncharacterized protein BYT42DRAFT_576077 [Radiomyces spectabilis]|uniref:uncharacterized protein n=1 Tax=Radiomyces spectabilis TaxID=64574 RepID=UPI00221EDF48|nr:uncharacterized protein BYT42DRAFT_576077 [Radiomyces spectabilis]KAI8374357.1 hypothetical protein BYT42DRAFT_576077 [Radiomyces spectabilis]